MRDVTTLRFSVDIETWPLAEAFVISRGAKTEAHVVVARLCDGTHTGRGEAVPYARYGETVDGVAAAIRDAAPVTSRAEATRLLPPGAARNALDCALWDLEAKTSGRTVAELAGLGAPHALLSAYTLSLDTPERMAKKAQRVPHLPLLKLKLGGSGDPERLRAVRQARPEARLIADANEAWTPDMLGPFLAAAAEAGVELIEQPLAAGQDEALAAIPHPMPICADESAHTSRDLEFIPGRYDAVNIKLDKAGGLTEALAMLRLAKAQGMKVMVGCMVATSLAMAPAILLAQDADWVDLDGPLLLARDRPAGLTFVQGRISPPAPALWG